MIAANDDAPPMTGDRMKSMRPDFEFDLGPGQILVLPRGWMHNPHARSQTQESVHVTFVARERTGYWIAMKLAQAALTSTALRRVIPPASVVDPAAFAEQVVKTRDLLTDWLAGADASALTVELRRTARAEPNVDYVSHAPSQIGQHQATVAGLLCATAYRRAASARMSPTSVSCGSSGSKVSGERAGSHHDQGHAGLR
ncbi:cupin domain-containing protein [Actinoplanes sp. NEAU-A12]|uniref:Cupin domain-containing protein n=1 Tax=Actinoplanes sandaracinus TaxID=3045177 RepID=A0ABT6WFB5_9ACTN|nr:cupin domain-containing protein [Actinoplanes sandaracinus]MDI6098373.1 cupin domain-containing protein [Actinoplanes sandaracinus]